MSLPWGAAKRVGETPPARIAVTLRVRPWYLQWSSAKTTWSNIALNGSPYTQRRTWGWGPPCST
jgi:hypothetical protein